MIAYLSFFEGRCIPLSVSLYKTRNNETIDKIVLKNISNYRNPIWVDDDWN